MVVEITPTTCKPYVQNVMMPRPEKRKGFGQGAVFSPLLLMAVSGQAPAVNSIKI
jgi:hypothetical protein